MTIEKILNSHLETILYNNYPASKASKILIAMGYNYDNETKKLVRAWLIENNILFNDCNL